MVHAAHPERARPVFARIGGLITAWPWERDADPVTRFAQWRTRPYPENGSDGWKPNSGSSEGSPVVDYLRSLMRVKYKETARGGLAVNVIEC